MHASSKQAILASSCVIFSLIGPLIFWLSSQESESTLRAKKLPTQSNLNATQLASQPQAKAWSFPKIAWFKLPIFNQNESLNNRFSLGEKVLVTANDSPEKELGVEKFKAGDFAEAIAQFSASLKANRNDPETLIYLNNAKAAESKSFAKIAVSVPISNNVNVANEILRGVAQYQDQVNREHKIHGKLLQVLIANDENNAEIGKKIANKLASDASILAVIGHQSSDVSIAAAPIYEAKGIVMLSPTSYARELSGIGKFIFRTTPSSRVFADTLAKHAVQVERNSKFAICSDSKSRVSQSFREDFIAAVYAAGGQITRTACNFSAPDFNPEEVASRATSDGATSLLLAPGVEQLKLAITVIQANKGRFSIIASPSMYTFETLQKGREAVNGLVMAIPWDPATAQDSTYLKHARQFWGGPGSWRTAMTYDAAKVIATGLNTGLSRQQLQKALSNPGFSVQGVTGTLQFLPTGDRNRPGTLVKILPGKKSGTGYDFVTLKP